MTNQNERRKNKQETVNVIAFIHRHICIESIVAQKERKKYLLTLQIS